jgi:hypothetical protein
MKFFNGLTLMISVLLLYMYIYNISSTLFIIDVVYDGRQVSTVIIFRMSPCEMDCA